MGPAGSDPDRFSEIFRTALRLVVVEGAPSFGVARSRASVLTFRSAFGLDADTAQEIRCRVAREECARLGLEPLSGTPPFTPDPVEVADLDDEEREEEPVRVPRGRALADAHPRNSGKR